MYSKRFSFLQVSTVEESLKEARIYVTTTGCKGIVQPAHFEHMLEDSILCNIGHYDCEVDVAWLNANCAQKERIKPQVINYPFKKNKVFSAYFEIRSFVFNKLYAHLYAFQVNLENALSPEAGDLYHLTWKQNYYYCLYAHIETSFLKKPK